MALRVRPTKSAFRYKFFHLLERAPGVSVEEIKTATEGNLIVKGDIPEMII